MPLLAVRRFDKINVSFYEAKTCGLNVYGVTSALW